MPLDPQAAAFLAIANDGNPPDISEVPISVTRTGLQAAKFMSGAREDVGHVTHTFIPGPTADLPIRIFTPKGSGPFNGLVYFHGGGWCVFFDELYEPQLRSLANSTKSVVISVNYQKAPEHKFPIPFDDCYATLEWVFQNSESLNINQSKIGIAGDSAGGNLASAVALKVRDQGLRKLAYQLLIYPCNDRKFDYSSMLSNGEGYGLTKKGMEWLWEQYLNDNDDDQNPYAIPHVAKSYRNLPPTIIITAEYDVLHDDGAAYAQKLIADNVPTIYRDYPGQIHGFFSYSEDIDEGKNLRKEFARDINGILSAG